MRHGKGKKQILGYRIWLLRISIHARPPWQRAEQGCLQSGRMRPHCCGQKHRLFAGVDVALEAGASGWFVEAETGSGAAEASLRHGL